MGDSMSLTIRTKLIIAFLLSIVVAIGSVSAVVSIEIRRASLKDFEDSSSAQLERVNDFIATFFESAQRNVAYLASLPRVVEGKGQVASYADTKQDFKLNHGNLTPPEQALDSHKRRALVRAANAYLTENPFAGEVQFDLIAVETAPAGTPEVRYIEDAIELHW